ncbi:MAG TPA: tRNA guanosine(34) transglycosylase Tgt [Acidobacteriota bacterium]|nr:tRNA guanosine(34) transglycosylase Tgt [Acidobacteriota bacterium]
MASESIFTLRAEDGGVRRGEVSTGHGEFQTPVFMPVGTSGTVKALTSRDLHEIGAQIILGNTYHLYLRPGPHIIKGQGGLAAFMGWRGPTLTDSGGFQVFSLKDINSITDEGVEFQSHIDGSRHLFTPEKVMEIQHTIGADIIMVFDECVPYPADSSAAALGVKRTYDWARRCRARLSELNPDSGGRPALFGIVQGSVYKDLRSQSAQQIVDLDFAGNAIGGLSVGESKEEMEATLAHTIAYLPKDRPRYLMGVGYPEDILMAVSYGVDMFDCVLPTRNARTGQVFTSEGPLVYRNAEFASDDRPLDPNCDCRVCRTYSRAYLRHLYNQSEITGMVLASYHSSYFFQKLLRNIRKSIEDGCFEMFRKEFLWTYLAGDG